MGLIRNAGIKSDVNEQDYDFSNILIDSKMIDFSSDSSSDDFSDFGNSDLEEFEPEEVEPIEEKEKKEWFHISL